MKLSGRLPARFRDRLAVLALVLGVGVVAAVAWGDLPVYSDSKGDWIIASGTRERLRLYVDLRSFHTQFANTATNPNRIDDIPSDNDLLRLVAAAARGWEKSGIPYAMTFRGTWPDDRPEAPEFEDLEDGEAVIRARRRDDDCGTTDNLMETNHNTPHRKVLITVHAVDCNSNPYTYQAAVRTTGDVKSDALGALVHEAGHLWGVAHAIDDSASASTASDREATQTMWRNTATPFGAPPEWSTSTIGRFGPRWEELKTLRTQYGTTPGVWQRWFFGGVYQLDGTRAGEFANVFSNAALDTPDVAVVQRGNNSQRFLVAWATPDFRTVAVSRVPATSALDEPNVVDALDSSVLVGNEALFGPSIAATGKSDAMLTWVTTAQPSDTLTDRSTVSRYGEVKTLWSTDSGANWQDMNLTAIGGPVRSSSRPSLGVVKLNGRNYWLLTTTNVDGTVRLRSIRIDRSARAITKVDHFSGTCQFQNTSSVEGADIYCLDGPLAPGCLISFVDARDNAFTLKAYFLDLEDADEPKEGACTDISQWIHPTCENCLLTAVGRPTVLGVDLTNIVGPPDGRVWSIAFPTGYSTHDQNNGTRYVWHTNWRLSVFDELTVVDLHQQDGENGFRFFKDADVLNWHRTRGGIAMDWFNPVDKPYLTRVGVLVLP